MSLDALRARGWDGCEVKPDGRGAFRVPLFRPDSQSAAYVYHRNADLAERMALAAALVAEGHDLIGLLRDASVMLASGDAYAAEMAGRIDAVLAAVDGHQ